MMRGGAGAERAPRKAEDGEQAVHGEEGRAEAGGEAKAGTLRKQPS